MSKFVEWVEPDSDGRGPQSSPGTLGEKAMGDGRGGTRGRALSSISVRDFKGITIMLYSIQISRLPLPISNYPRRSSAYFPNLKGVEVIARAGIDEDQTILPTQSCRFAAYRLRIVANVTLVGDAARRRKGGGDNGLAY
jgi:hypothetical protein